MAKVGRPPIQIDWDHFFKLISYQTTQLEIADFFSCTVETIDAHCRAELGESFSAIWARKISLGKIRIRKAVIDHIERGTPGWSTAANRIDEKIGLWGENPPERPALPLGPALAIGNGKRTFAEFCAKSGYPPPFAKQEEMRAFGFEQTDTRLLLGSRGYGKTDYLTILGTAYDVYLNPSTSNLILTKTKERGSAIIAEIAEALVKNGLDLAIANTQSIQVKGETGKDRAVAVLSLRSSLRGRHPYRILMDDPVTEEDVSDAMRRLVKRKYNEALKLTNNICIIGQPAHPFDLYAELREIVLKMEVPHGSIPELDHNLEALKKAGVDPHSIEMSYHLRIPKDGASIFANLNFIENFPAGASIAFIDPSDGGDYTAWSIIRSHFDGIAVVGFAMQRAWYHCIDEMVASFQRFNVIQATFETNKHGNQPIHQLSELLSPIGIGILGAHSDSNKHAAIVSAGSYAHMIHLSRESDKTYTDHVVQYQYGAKFDDAPDSLARGMITLGLIKGKK